MAPCVFCKIAAHELPVEAVYEDEQILVFPDVNPQAPVHWLAIAKQHFANASETPTAMLGELVHAAATVARRELPGGYRLVMNTGDDGGQTVNHIHVHILGRRAMGWPPG